MAKNEKQKVHDMILLVSNTERSSYDLLNVSGIDGTALSSLLLAMDDNDRLDVWAYLESKGVDITHLADEQTREFREYHLDYIYNTDTHEFTDVKAKMELENEKADKDTQTMEESGNWFEIYQLKDVEETRDFRFMAMDYLEMKGIAVTKGNYDLVYTAPLETGMNLERIFEKFNFDRPADFTGHSLSVSDVVVLHQDGQEKSYYTDSIGFREVPEFAIERADKVSYYVIGDLATWAENSPNRSALERFDNLEDAMTKFSQYKAETKEYSDDNARATLGVSIGGIEFDVLHVRHSENYLVQDFTLIKAAQDNSRFLEDLQTIHDVIGFDKTRLHREMTPEEIKNFVKRRFEYQLKSSGLDDVSLYMERFDSLYEQGKMEKLMPSINQKRIVEDIPFVEWDNPYFEAKEPEQVMDAIADPAKQKEQTVEPAPEKVITLWVAECGEFHNLGEFHEGITSVDEAISVWSKIPPERMNGIPSIGINIHTEGTEHYEDMEMDIVSGKVIDLEVLDYVPDITDNPKAIEVIEKLVDKLPDIEVRGSLEKWQAAFLAAEIDQLSFDYDPYQYRDTVEDRDEQIASIMEDIRNGNTGYLQDFLNALVSESVREGIADVFGQGVALDDSGAVQTARKAQELLDKLAEYKPLAKVEELEEQNYNMIDNVLNNGAGEKKQEQSRSRISVKEKLAEKKAVIEHREKPERALSKKEEERHTQREI